MKIFLACTTTFVVFVLIGLWLDKESASKFDTCVPDKSGAIIDVVYYQPRSRNAQEKWSGVAHIKSKNERVTFEVYRPVAVGEIVTDHSGCIDFNTPSHSP